MTDETDDPVWTAWYADKDLTRDMLGSKLRFWFDPLAPWCDKPCAVLEVGSYEGRSAIAFLEYLPQCHLTAIDVFVNSAIEARFDRNMSGYGDRVTKIKDRAVPAMDRLLREKTLFDVIYLDTGKRRAVALTNSVLAWPLLRTGGVLIWDDLQWGAGQPDKERPGQGIRLFAEAFSECIEVLHEGRQLIARKIEEWPGEHAPRPPQ